MIYKLFGLPERYTPTPRRSDNHSDASILESDSWESLKALEDTPMTSSSNVASGLYVASDSYVASDFHASSLTVPEAITIYLACHEVAVKREALAEVFFQRPDTDRAFGNLRSNLNKIRREAKYSWASDYLETDGKGANFVVQCDVLDFEKAFQEKRFQTVIELYQGEFLEGFVELPSAPAFTEWVTRQRTNFKNKLYIATRELAQTLATEGRVIEALDLLNTRIQEDVMHDQAIALCADLMTLAFDTAQATKGLNCYSDYKRQLTIELDLEDSFEGPEELELLAQKLTDLSRTKRRVLGFSPSTSNNLLTKTSHIPPQATGFIGRDNEISELIAKLLNSNARMISLIGYGGVGKTRLGVQLATSLQDYYVDGVFVVELVATQSVDNIPSTINTVLGIKTEVGENPEDALTRVLQDKQLLLVLDNFEHLLEGRDLVDSLLGNNSSVDIIVTSREALNLSWEYAYDIEGLTYPRIKNPDLVYPKDLAEGEVVPENILKNEALPETAEDIADFESFDAVKLFLRSAEARVKDFSLDNNKVAIQQICSFVEGLPLGIELAASWVSSLSCEMIAETLQKDVSGIKTRLKDVPDRHKSLDVVFEHSWNLLTEQEKDVLAKTAIFHGGFDNNAAETITGTSLADLATLCDKSLLRMNDNGRYSLHEVIRQNAVGKLDEFFEMKVNIHAAHQKYYMDFVESCNYFELSDNFENIEAAWLNAIKTHTPNSPNLNSGEIFRKTYFSQGLYKRAISTIDTSLNLLNIESNTKDLNAIKIDLFRIKAYSLTHLGLKEEALPYTQQVLKLAKELNEPSMLANAYYELGLAHESRGKFNRAIDIFEEGLTTSVSESYKALFLSALARVQSKVGNFEESEVNYKKSIDITEQLGDHATIVRRKNHYSKLLFDLGKNHEAKTLIENTIAFAEKNNIKSTTYLLYKKQAQLLLQEGNIAEAWSKAQKALNICDEQGAKRAKPEIICVLGEISLESSDVLAAKEYFTNGLRLSIEVSNLDAKHLAILGLAQVHIEIYEHSIAVTLLHSLIQQKELRSSLKTKVDSLLTDIKTALSDVSYFKAVQKSNAEFINQYVLNTLSKG